jgi:hypothetical protein
VGSGRHSIEQCRTYTLDQLRVIWESTEITQAQADLDALQVAQVAAMDRSTDKDKEFYEGYVSARQKVVNG